MPSIIGNCNRFSLHRVKAELVEVKMENAEILKDWVRVSLTRRKPEPSLLSSQGSLFSSVSGNFKIPFFFFYIFCPENGVIWRFLIKVGIFFWVAYKRSGSLDFGTSTFEFWDCTWQAGQVFANSFFFVGKLRFYTHILYWFYITILPPILKYLPNISHLRWTDVAQLNHHKTKTQSRL